MRPAEGPAAGRRAPAAAGDQARLLVVEDEPTILELLSGSLRFAGFDVATGHYLRNVIVFATLIH